jgi:hypothetical protein
MRDIVSVRRAADGSIHMTHQVPWVLFLLSPSIGASTVLIKQAGSTNFGPIHGTFIAAEIETYPRW